MKHKGKEGPEHNIVFCSVDSLLHCAVCKEPVDFGEAIFTIAEDIARQQQDLPLQYHQILNDNFWELTI